MNRRVLISTAVLVAVVVTVTATHRSRSPAPVRTTSTTTTTMKEVTSSCGRGGKLLATAAELKTALEEANPGEHLVLTPGIYLGNFDLTRSGTAARPIQLCGPNSAVLSGGTVRHGYGLHLLGVHDVRLIGFTITAAQKGLVLDHAHAVTIDRLTVEGIGDEAIHLRSSSTDNLVTHVRIEKTGLRNPTFGEGIYVGSAGRHWVKSTADASDRNRFVGNVIRQTTAEAYDIKEGTRSGKIEGGTVDGSAEIAADSVINLKGNSWTVAHVTVEHGPRLGISTRVRMPGWGAFNLVVGNRIGLDGSGPAISFEDNASTHNRAEFNVDLVGNALSASGS